MKTILSIALATAGMAAAGQITYTLSDTGSGSLVLASIQNFTDATITFTQVSDTSQVASCIAAGTVCSPKASNTVTISGIGTFTVNENTFFFDDVTTPGVGFSGTGGDLLDETDAAFVTYGLTTSLGPITDSEIYTGSISNLLTSGGQLSVNFGPNATFTAVTATPEPGSLALILAGALPLGLAALRRRPRDFHKKV